MQFVGLCIISDIFHIIDSPLASAVTVARLPEVYFINYNTSKCSHPTWAQVSSVNVSYTQSVNGWS